MSDILIHITYDDNPEIVLETRNIIDQSNNIVGQLTLPNTTTEAEWTSRLLDFQYQNPQLEAVDAVKVVIKDARRFGENLLENFSAENVLMGITAAGKTGAVVNYLHKLSHYISTGSLYEAINEVDALIAAGLPEDLEPFVTEERLNDYKNTISEYLA